MKHFIIGAYILLSLASAGCQMNNAGPETTGPEPPPPITFLSRDTISQGNYRDIIIDSSTDKVFSVLEDYRKKKMVTYLGAVNNYFSEVTELKDRIHLFENIAFDEKTDTDSGIQLTLEAGKVKNITLNNRRELKQWPETSAVTEAIQIGDMPEVLYEKLLSLSKKSEYAHKFEKIILSTRYTYALYDPAKANLPWSFIYVTEPGIVEEVQVYFKDKKVDYIIVTRYKRD